MYNFTDLIVRSYLLYTDKLKKNKNIAHFFFQEYHLVRPDANEKHIFSKTQFYIELIEKIDSFLGTCKHNYEVEESLYYDVCIEAKDFEAWERIDLKKKQAIYDEDGIYFTLSFFNWEEIENAEHLNEALINGLNLKDAIFIISPNKEIQAKDLVLRKSKLEYLKTEAIRARDANSIDELSIEKKLNENLHIKLDDLSVYNISNIENIVKNHFQFTLEKNNRKKKQMLSDEEYLKLVNWVTYFLKNNYEIPYIDTPIMGLNIGKTKVRITFKRLINLYHPSHPKPKSFYILISKCFYALKDDTEDTIQKTSDPDKEL